MSDLFSHQERGRFCVEVYVVSWEPVDDAGSLNSEELDSIPSTPSQREGVDPSELSLGISLICRAG